jgi:hypothetical protein
MKNIGNELLVGAVVIFAFLCFFSTVKVVYRMHKEIINCEQNGGFYYTTRVSVICLKKDKVIQ